MASDTPGRETRARGRAWTLVTLVLAFVVWHAIFDVTLDRAMKAYVDAQARHGRGAGPAVSIRASMQEARRRGAQMGLAGAAAVAALSFGVWTIRTRRRGLGEGHGKSGSRF
jgi:hypothetical protein